MSTSTSPFCEHCGAANEPQASYCCFCGHPLDERREPDYASVKGILQADTLLKGRYRIVKEVGQGGMGTVYRAQDTELNNRAVAVKEMILSGLSAKEVQEATEAFKREATLLAGLQHANLPSVFEHFVENGRWYMVMTFVPGETLEDYLQRTNRNKLPLNEVLQIGRQLCEVLYYLHTQYPPIIFRDVKPANIMRTPDGHIYLIDFGVARRFRPGKKKDTVPFGSLGYAPPEQFGKAQTTPHSDIYSLGATLHQLLTGHEPDTKPFHFPPLHSLEPKVAAQLGPLIRQMLDRDEKKRPANMLIVGQRLQEIVELTAPFQPFSQAAPAPTPAARKSALRRASLAAGIALLMFGGLIGGLIGRPLGENEANDTNRINNYATIDAGVSATVSAQASATAEAEAGATSTTIQNAALPDPYQPAGKLVLVDPLSSAGAWTEYTDADFGGQCQFNHNILQVSQTRANRFYHCDEANGTVFQNFTVEVKMTIILGDCGGLVLREDRNGNGELYYFEVCSDASYYFYCYTSNNDNTTLANGEAKTINIGLSENTIAVVANGSTFDLYVNHQKIASLTDTTYDMGTIGLVASDLSSDTTVLYQDIKVWALP